MVQEYPFDSSYLRPKLFLKVAETFCVSVVVVVQVVNH